MSSDQDLNVRCLEYCHLVCVLTRKLCFYLGSKHVLCLGFVCALSRILSLSVCSCQDLCVLYPGSYLLVYALARICVCFIQDPISQCMFCQDLCVLYPGSYLLVYALARICVWLYPGSYLLVYALARICVCFIQDPISQCMLQLGSVCALSRILSPSVCSSQDLCVLYPGSYLLVYALARICVCFIQDPISQCMLQPGSGGFIQDSYLLVYALARICVCFIQDPISQCMLQLGSVCALSRILSPSVCSSQDLCVFYPGSYLLVYALARICVCFIQDPISQCMLQLGSVCVLSRILSPSICSSQDLCVHYPGSYLLVYALARICVCFIQDPISQCMLQLGSVCVLSRILSPSICSSQDLCVFYPGSYLLVYALARICVCFIQDPISQCMLLLGSVCALSRILSPSVCSSQDLCVFYPGSYLLVYALGRICVCFIQDPISQCMLQLGSVCALSRSYLLVYALARICVCFIQDSIFQCMLQLGSVCALSRILSPSVCSSQDLCVLYPGSCVTYG